MASKSDQEREEIQARLKATLAGAFKGSPTQLKNIPKARGEKRAEAREGEPPPIKR